MPVFPGGNPQTRLSPSSPVEISSTRDARIAGEQMQQLSQGVSKVGEFVADAEVTSAQNFAGTAATSARLRAESESNKDGSNIPSLTEQYTKENLAGVRDQFSDPVVNKRMENYYQQVSLQNQVHATATMLDKKTKYGIDLTKDNFDQSAKRVEVNPELATIELSTARKNLDNNVKSGLFSEFTAQQMWEVNAEKVANARVSGLIQQKKYGQIAQELGATDQDLTMEMTPDQLGAYGLQSDGNQKLGYKMKNGEVMDPAMSAVYRELKPEARDHYLNKIRIAREQDAHANVSTNMTLVRAITDESLKGNIITPANDIKAKSAIAGLPDEIRPAAQEQYDTAKALAPIMYIAKNGTPDQANKAYGEFVSSRGVSDNPVIKNKTDALVSKAAAGIQSIWEEKRKDINQYSIDNNPDLAAAHAKSKSGDPVDMQNYIAKATAAAVASGVTPRITTNQEAEQIGMSMKAAISSDPIVSMNELNKLEQKYGSNLPEVISEVHLKDKSGIDPSMVIAANMVNDGSKIMVFDNIKNKKVIEEEFKKRIPEDSQKSLKENLNNQMDAFQASIADSSTGMGSIIMTGAFRDQIEVQTQKLILRGVSVKDAVNQAQGSIVDSNFSFVKTSSSTVMIPKSYNTSTIAGFLSENDPRRNTSGGHGGVNTSLISKFNIGVNKYDRAENPNVDENTLQKNKLNLISGNALWVTNSTQTGVNLVFRHNGSLEPILNKDGKPVTAAYKDLGNYYSKVGQ